MDKPDPYVELCQVMQDLEVRGVPSADIIDAALKLAVTAGARLYNAEAMACSLRDVAEVIEACQMSASPQEWP
jgi:hypothetical protein